MSIRKLDLEAMSVDDLWSLHEKISQILSARIMSEKQELEKRLALLHRGNNVIEIDDPGRTVELTDKVRRKYPRVFPKYRNSSAPYETWSGRGRQPRWMVAAIESGKDMDDFRIRDVVSAKTRNKRA